MKLIILPLLSLFLIFGNSFVQEHSSLLTPQGMQQDLQVLKTAWEQFHPGLYRFNTKREVDSLFDHAAAQASKPLSRKEFYLLLSGLTEKLRCGHTYPNFWNQTAEVEADVFSASVLPVLFRVIDNRIIITHNLSAELVVPGDEIISINDVSCEQLFEKLITVSRSDGRNSLHKKMDNFCIYPVDADSSGYAFFDVYAPLFFNQLFNANVFSCTLKNCNGKKRNVTFRAMTKAERHKEYVKRFGTLPSGETNWSLKQLTRETAVLRIGDFETWNWNKDYRIFLDSIFTVIKNNGTASLVIDIRGNEGGADDARDYLFRCITDKPFVKTPALRLQTFLSVPDSLRPLFKTWNKELFLAQSPLHYEKYENRYYYEKQLTQPDTLFPKSFSFTGKCCLLTNATNSSAAFTLANMFQQSDRGLIIGEPTGGSKQGINGGQFFLLYLPYSGIEIDLPLIWQKPVSDAPDNGVVPDRIVYTSRAAICSGRDEQLEAAINSLQRKTK